MVQWDLPRTPTSAQLVARLGLERGVPAATLLAGTRLDLGALDDPRAEVGPRQELRLAENLVAALGDPPGLGLAAGARYHLTAYGLWSFMLISSPTPRNAVELALRYVDLTFAFCALEPREADGELVLALSPAEGVPLSVRRFFVEREAAAIHTIQAEAFGQGLGLRRVAFSAAAPAERAFAQQVFGIAPEYDAAEDLIAFDATHLDDPMPQANEHAAAMALEQCRDLLQRRRARAGLAGRVRDQIAARIVDPPDAGEVATTLHMSSRSLQRRLAEEGTSFRALLDEVRERLAEELLVTGRVPVSEVAHRLGYVEVSSFSQAFRRWKGMGPRDYRRQRAGVLAGR